MLQGPTDLTAIDFQRVGLGSWACMLMTDEVVSRITGLRCLSSTWLLPVLLVANILLLVIGEYHGAW